MGIICINTADVSQQAAGQDHGHEMALTFSPLSV